MSFWRLRTAVRGFREDQFQRVFDRFYRVEEGRSRESGGAGLGTSDRPVEREIHGGRVRVKSEPGKGCVFSVILPRVASVSGSEGSGENDASLSGHRTSTVVADIRTAP